MRLTDDLTKIKGIGEKTAQVFSRAGIDTVEDLIHYYPRAYEECAAPVSIASLQDSGPVVVCGALAADAKVRRAGKLKIVDAVIRDETGSLKVTWFNMMYLKDVLRAGRRYVMKGKLSVSRFGMVLEQPVIYSLENYVPLIGKLKPVYSLPAGLTSKGIEKAVKEAFAGLGMLKEFLPSSIRREYRLAEYNYALRTIHFPPDKTELTFARHRLVFDEFFLFILAVRYLRDVNEVQENGCRIEPSPVVDRFEKSLPFALTGAQKRCYQEILADLTGPKLMNRLIQGDVGSGKTIVALLSLMQMACAGYQGALMAPTEVLARQHYENFTRLFAQASVELRVELLTGSMTAKEKREAYARIANHEADIVVGTHAIIQDKVHFARLGLVITDEQHRFGVRQREILAQKGQEGSRESGQENERENGPGNDQEKDQAGAKAESLPHVLVMSATPIPRTLAIILYGDLDISVIDEKPVGRLPIKNCVIGASRRKKAYEFITGQVKEGRQAYVICPMVEDSSAMEGENVQDYAKKLAEELPPSIVIGTLHGRMKPSEKNHIMEEFAAGRIQVLVSTTVVEVGVDVPNATVMVVENAERFGLAQLHQLRGRIGRGQHQSYCIFINGSDASKIKRLEILTRTNDGFEIASEDLKLRGPGDIFGLRQSGLMDFALGDIYTDAGILKEASEAARQVLEEDYGLSREENLELKKRLDGYLTKKAEMLSL